VAAALHIRPAICFGLKGNSGVNDNRNISRWPSLTDLTASSRTSQSGAMSTIFDFVSKMCCRKRFKYT